MVDMDGNPLAGAKVTGEDGFSAVTGTDGKFIANGLYSIRHSFTVTKDGYLSRTVRFDVAEGTAIRKDVVLAPSGGEISEKYILADFEGEFNVGGNSVVTRSFNTVTEYVYSGAQSLKVGFPTGWGPVRAFIDSGSEALNGSDRQFVNYTNTDWSGYDAIAMYVYNATSAEQTLYFEFMYDRYSWSSSVLMNVKLAAGQWNRVEIPFSELRDAGANLKNIIRLSLAMREFPTYGATLYFDDIALLKYNRKPPADTYIELPSPVPTMDIGAEWEPVVKIVRSRRGKAGMRLFPALCLNLPTPRSWK
ncbi:carboxypeptidase-like regulatory domain-containing protein [Paenibacillus cisolokensis]|uniref:carboxypeptidase-like regulatory domain-containing protein n=1 Tax=Paenibacillus cisolokensis TaxID=1658519 RepID=UPI00245650B2|nr:carboxypeptidase-like regulatory domain-containing protein [Paenibacillus cisolokensis]